MNPEFRRVKEVFLAALEHEDRAGRAAYLQAACGTDDVLRRQAEALLGQHEQAGSFLESPAPELDATRDLPPVTERPGTVIGPYKLLEQIGEGGFGVVFMAEQQKPVRRRVALKVLKPGMDTGQVVARFEAERQALALMDHPHIAKVFDAGSTETGRPYFVMELVRGVPVTEFCDHNHLPVRERLELFIAVCQAVQHAHQKGVIHRDLKPSNVLVTLHDGVPVAKVIDFGIAKAMGQQLTERTLFTNFAQMVGTPLYMSPEQAEMSGLDVDTRTDIYALGVLLYELLTGTTPLDKERLKTAGYDEIRRIIREQEPARPSTRVSTLGAAAATISASRQTDPAGLRRLFRGELDWIVMKCLEKDRNRRYETAASLVADVRRFLSDEPVQACPPSAAYRFRKFARRNRGPVLAASLVLFALVVGVTGTTIGLLRAEQQRRNAESNEHKALAAAAAERQAKDDLRRDSYFHRIALAHRELSVDNLYGTLKFLDECPEDLREWEWYYLMRLCKVEPVVLRDGTAFNGVAFSPDGEQLASAGGDGWVKIWNSKTGDVVSFRAHTDSVACVTFHPDGRHLATAGADRLVKVWDLTNGQQVFSGQCDALRKFGGAYTVAFRPPDGRQLAAGSDGVMRVWDWEDDQLRHAWPGYEGHSFAVAFSPDGRLLATADPGQHRLRLFDMGTGELLRTLPGHRHPVSALAFSPDGGRLASAGLDRSVNVHDTTTGERLCTFTHTGNVLCVAFSPDGRRLASAGEDKTVRVWDASTGRELLGLRGHTEVCTCLAFSPDPEGRRLVSASPDGTIRIWDATPLQGNEGQESLTFTKHTDELRSVAFSPDGQKIVSAGHGGLAKVWDAATGQVSLDFPGHNVMTWSLAWQPPEGRRIASAGAGAPGQAVKVWDAGNGREVFELRAGPLGRPYFAVAFSPDGQYLVTGKQDGGVDVWNAATGGKVHKLGTHDQEIRGLAFSPDGRWLASASSDGVVKIWHAKRLDQSQQAHRTFQSRVPGPSLTVAFSPDGQRLAAAGKQNTVKIWDVETRRELHSLQGHNGDVYTVAFSPDQDGRWLASAGEDSAVKIWDSHSGALVRNFRGHTGLVSTLAFSPDGKRLCSGSRDKTVKVWDLSKLGEEPNR